MKTHELGIIVAALTQFSLACSDAGGSANSASGGAAGSAGTHSGAAGASSSAGSNHSAGEAGQGTDDRGGEAGDSSAGNDAGAGDDAGAGNDASAGNAGDVSDAGASSTDNGGANGGSVAAARFFLPTGVPDNTTAPSIEIDAQGGIHALYPAYAGGDAYYAY